jgi:PiT family inorganic phosphate transporter
MVYVLIGLALVFDFLNGFHDSSNVVATPISSGAMNPRAALYTAAVTHFVAPFLFGVAVATAIGDGLLDDRAITINVVVAGLFSAVVWNLLTWYLGLPSSSSHALVGGLLGQPPGRRVHCADRRLTKIMIALLVSPPGWWSVRRHEAHSGCAQGAAQRQHRLRRAQIIT